MLLTLAQRGSEEGGIPELLRGETPTSILFLLFVIPAALFTAAMLIAVAIRLSSRVLGFGEPDYKNACICAVTYIAIQFGIGFSLGLNAGIISSMSEETGRHPAIGMALLFASPLVAVVVTAQALFFGALVFSRMLRVDGGASRLMYWDSCVLVGLTSGMLAGFTWVIMMVIKFLFALV